MNLLTLPNVGRLTATMATTSTETCNLQSLTMWEKQPHIPVTAT